MKNRMISQDIAKGIAILIVMQAHTFQMTKGIGSVICVLFGYAMPFFVFMTGYNYRNKGFSPWQNIKKRNWQILRPFLIYSFTLFFIMGAYFLIRNEASSLGELLQSFGAALISKWGAQMIGLDLPKRLFQSLFGPYWFLQFLITANIVFYLCVERALSSRKSLISWTILLSGISVVLIELGIVLPWGIQNAPAIASVMILAAWFHKNDSLFSEPSKKRWAWINAIVCLLIVAMIELKYAGAGFMGGGALGEVCGGAEVFFFIVISIVGSYFMINIGKLLEKVRILSTALAWLGRHTLEILMLHTTVIHIVKDILNLPLSNTAEQLFVEKFDPKGILAYLLTVAFVTLLIILIEKTRTLVTYSHHLNG